MATTIRIPLELLTVQPDTANAFWAASAGATIDWGAVRYVDGGEGNSTWWGIVPQNVAATPAWSVDYYCASNTAGANGVVVVSARGRVVQNLNTIDAAYTTLSSANTHTLSVTNSMNIVASSGGNYDTSLALVATAFLLVEVNRHGGNASDTIQGFWDLYGVTLRVDIT